MTKKTYVLVPVEEEERGEEPPLESPAPPWMHLVVRKLPWRKQLYIKGRNMTVRQMLSTVTASGFTPEEAAQDLDLPVEAIREAFAYALEYEALLDYETAYERLQLVQRRPFTR